jgi:hypothetical protein
METAKIPHKWWMDQENVVFIHNGILFSHKEKWILSFVSKWIGQENIILSELSQAQKAKKSHVLPHMQIIDPKQMQEYYWTWVTH